MIALRSIKLTALPLNSFVLILARWDISVSIVKGILTVDLKAVQIMKIHTDKMEENFFVLQLLELSKAWLSKGKLALNCGVVLYLPLVEC